MKQAQKTGMKRIWCGIAALACLSACEPLLPSDGVAQKPPGTGTTAPDAIQPTSEQSAVLRSYLAQVQSSQLTQGLLRQDGGGPDTPFTADMLARNFEQIVFYNEYTSGGQRRGASGQLRRWSMPVRMGIEFGASVPPSQQAQDRQDVSRYARRLARVTRHPVSVAANPNFLVLFVSEDDRTATIDRIADRLPGIDARNLQSVRNLPDDAYCAVVAFAGGSDPSTYSAAVAVIRAENPDLLRLSCIHEELAQGLGLANDSPDARPSIFNDDDEFALLTNHDELLLGMLYDPRLKPGMSLTEASPFVREIASELRDTGGAI